VKKHGEEVDRLVNELGVPWRASHFSDMTGNSERFVFVYDGDHVQEVIPPHFINSPDVAVFDRTPYQATFKAGNFDFTLISVHLSYADSDRRRREAEALAHYVSNVSSWPGDKDVIVLGDFNEQGRGNLHFFSDMGWESLNHDPSNLSSTETYDTFVIDPKFTREWNGTAASVHFDETLFGNDDARALEEVSDHRPAYADFVTNLPDDD
jgi:endonuclease/exonuclease/phosphatase family metal-dependent hydrolase